MLDSNTAPHQLQADRGELQRFTDALFRYADEGTFVSLRAFYEGRDEPFRITPVKLNGAGLAPLVSAADSLATQCANAPEPIVFCPPVATFADSKRARETDLVNGLALSVECDQNPAKARRKLEALLGPATIVLASGGEWIDPETGEFEDKLHLHWRLTEPTREMVEHTRLKEARRLATALVGGDHSNQPVVHPIRWAGSWHRKKAPRLARILSETESELELGDALERLREAFQAAGLNDRSSKAGTTSDSAPGEARDTAELIRAVMTAEDYHAPLAALAMRFLKSGMQDGQAVLTLRGIMLAIPESERGGAARWQARYDDIPRAVSTARGKIGKGPADAKPQPERHGFAAADLDRQEFPPIRYIVPGFLPEGLTLLAARPKMGKSWLSLDWAAAVAFGGMAMGSVACEGGDVLCLALEDNWRRLQKRMRTLLGDGPKPERLLFFTDWPRLDQGGLEEIEAWADRAKNPRLVIIDTLAKLRPARDNRETQYEGDYRAMTGLHRLANDRGLAVLGVHHTRKAEADDPFDTVSGTSGLTGAADTILVLRRDTTGHVILHGRGRDLEELEIAMRFEAERGLWSPIGSAAEVRRSDERNTILDALDDAGEPMSPADIAIATGMRAENVRFLLHKMMKAGEITKARYGRYAANTANTANTGGESE